MFRTSTGWSGTSRLIFVTRFDLFDFAHGILLVIGFSGSLSVKNDDVILVVDLDVNSLFSFPEASPLVISFVCLVSFLKPFGNLSSLIDLVSVMFLSSSFVLLLFARSVFIVDSMYK